MWVNALQCTRESIVIAQKYGMNRGETGLVTVAFIASDETRMQWGGSAILLLITLRQGFAVKITIDHYNNR
jgi:hypothetical protein